MITDISLIRFKSKALLRSVVMLLIFFTQLTKKIKIYQFVKTLKVVLFFLVFLQAGK